ncbi:hypothetical protein GQ53DRAFT_797885 [Thozetella sp. PMI_491]|nr:hypothetical protein GQ53DRAFT_797885 [Thozetella sp. PMI_491]
MASRVPPLLEAYLALPPEAAQIVLTGILGASTNWLCLRYLYSFLSTPTSRPADAPTSSSSGGSGTCVVLVSFLRDYAFWRDGASRLGVDLEALGRAGRFAFVDGLSGLFTSLAPPGPGPGAPRPPGVGATGPESVPRSGPLPHGRQPIPVIRQPAGGSEGALPSWRRVLCSGRVADVSAAVGGAVDGLLANGKQTQLEDTKVFLVIDQLDLLLAATGATVLALQDMMLDLREKVHATVLTLAADEPLVIPQTTVVEKEHASLVLSMAHESEMVVSLRLLDTGTAKDVSGVMRVSQGGQDSGRAIEETEYLYHVGGDGGVRVFERGQ